MNWKNYDEVKEALRIKLIPVEGNEDMLEQIPHRTYEDIAMIYIKEIYASSSGERAYATFTNADMEIYGVTAEQVYEDAMEAENAQAYLCSIGQMLGGIEQISGAGLYCVTTGDHCGAWAIFKPGAMKAFARSMKCDGYYILPSSIHEMLLFPDKSLSVQELKQMVVEVNATAVDPKDKLTDSVYYYDCETDSFRKVA